VGSSDDEGEGEGGSSGAFVALYNVSIAQFLI
jgi:hypothetical protein